jgi:YHS domain-containing protein
MAETPRFAHLALLLFLGCVFLISVSVVIALISALARSWNWTKASLAVAVAGGCGYVVFLLGTGIVSRAKTLAPGEWKYFCEEDCHIAYSITDVRRVDSVAGELAPASSSSRSLVLVTLKTWFDEHSIASFRGNAPLWPPARRVVLLDAADHIYERAPDPGADSRSLEPSTPPSTPMTGPLHPGESHETLLAFAVPPGSHGLRLLIADADPVSHIIIDHENSPFHGKIYLALPPAQDSMSKGH